MLMTLLVVSLSSVNDILKVFLKVFHPRLQFTVKIEENQLNFLDVNIIKVITLLNLICITN